MTDKEAWITFVVAAMRSGAGRGGAFQIADECLAELRERFGGDRDHERSLRPYTLKPGETLKSVDDRLPCKPS